MFARVVRPLSTADISAAPRPAGFPRVVEMAVAADEMLRVVSLVSAAHLFPVGLDLKMTAAADEALRVVRLRSAAGSSPCVLQARFEVVGATDPIRPVVRVL